MNDKNNVVKNSTEGYGYHYASLGDIANQGFKIPKMKTGTNENGREFIYYYDTELGEWVRGAEVIIPESKAMNKAQLYGSALTYARRYTTLMALSLACDDDKDVENLNADGTSKVSKPASEKQIDYIKSLYAEDVLPKIAEHYKVANINELTSEQAKEVIERRKNGKVNNQ